MPTPMIDVFTRRPDRFRLLDAAVRLAGWQKGAALLECGCAYGDAAAHMAARGFDVTAADIDERVIAEAKKRRGESGCRFLAADVTALPFENGSFDGLYSEAAFSVLADKSAALREYSRVLRNDGKIILNDFARRDEQDTPARTGIPCMDGALTLAGYVELFASAGFERVDAKEDMFEFAKILRLIADEYMEAIRALLVAEGGNVPHLKVFVTGEGSDFAKASLTGVDYDIEFDRELERQYHKYSVVVNARAACTSKRLDELMEQALDKTVAKYALDCHVFSTECFGMTDEGR